MKIEKFVQNAKNINIKNKVDRKGQPYNVKINITTNYNLMQKAECKVQNVGASPNYIPHRFETPQGRPLRSSVNLDKTDG